MIHPDTEFRRVDDVVGFGVFATRFIPRGTITWARCALDRALTEVEISALPPAYAPHVDKYAYLDRRGHSILCWDLARFMNHSCAATCLSPGFDVDVAVTDLQPGDELTCDYGMLNLVADFHCACRKDGCRGTIGDDWDALAASWDARIRAVFPRVVEVPQPLAPFLSEAGAIFAAARGEAPVPSCEVHRYTAKR